MLLVKTYLKETKSRGIGLFASEGIESGTLVCKNSMFFDIPFLQEDVDAFPKIQKDFIYKYGCKKKDGNWLFNIGNERFMNHSHKPNIELIDEHRMSACRDIEKDEEILCDYRTICEMSREELEFDYIEGDEDEKRNTE